LKESKMIITLCGSARFEKWFHGWNEALSLSGHCVFGLASYPSQHEGEKNWYSVEQKTVLDAVHKGKIFASHAIFVLNAFAYIGESTLSEIEWAKLKKRSIYYLQSWGEGLGISTYHSKEVRAEAERLGVPAGFGSPISTVSRSKDIWDLLPPAGAFRNAIVNELQKRGVD
jgi:hypothetical protein